MGKEDCRYGFKITEKVILAKDRAPRVGIIVSSVMDIPSGVRDRVDRNADGSVEILRSFSNPDAAERACEAEQYAASFERDYRFDQEEALCKLRYELSELKRLGLSCNAVGKLLGRTRTLRHILHGGGDHPSLPRVLARVTYLHELFADTADCVDNFLSWPKIGKRSPKSARWFRTPSEIENTNREHLHALATALLEDDDY